MKTDYELKRDIEAELGWDPEVPAESIGVSVNEGVVTLSGHIATYAQKHAVERALARLHGIKAVALELDVKLAPEHRRSDTEIATSINQTLQSDVSVDAEKVRVTVDKGWVTLEGEVDWDYQRRAVSRLIRGLPGVVGINNDMHIRPVSAASDVRQRIFDALSRQSSRQAQHLKIDFVDGCVTLRGIVHSRKERDAVQGAAWSAPGVSRVVDDLVVE